MPWSRHPEMANPTVFFSIAMAGEPMGGVSFKLFAGKVPKTAENFPVLSTGEKGLGYKGSCLHRIFWALGAREVTSDAIMALAASPSVGRNVMRRISR